MYFVTLRSLGAQAALSPELVEGSKESRREKRMSV